jgi:EpsI family protein
VIQNAQSASNDSMSSPGAKSFALDPTLAILAGGAGAVVYALIRFWGANPDYVDRFLILGASAWVIWQAYPELRLMEKRPALVGHVPLLVGVVAFPTGWFLHAQVGPKPVVLWWLMIAWLCAVGGVVLVSGGWLRLARLTFPLGFLLFALPIPNRILVPLQFALQSATTVAAAEVLPHLGVSVERSGFVLGLPNGDLGVAEACSGVRSVTALSAIAAFVAWWRGFGFLRGALLVGLSIPVIASVNAVRVIVSGLIQEHLGAEFVRGHWHEALGVAMVLLGLGLILFLARLGGDSRCCQLAAKPSTATLVPASPAMRFHFLTFVLLAGSFIATIAAQFLGAGAQQELVAAAPIDQIPQQLGRWKGNDVPVTDEIREMLTADAIVHREYRDLGYEVTAWVIYWSSRNMVKGYHHPDVCWRNRGFRQEKRDLALIAAGGGTIPVTVREFANDSEKRPTRQLILYWTQEGRRVWSEEDERRVQAAGDSHEWLGERLFQREPVGATGRLVVLIGTQLWDNGTVIRAQTLDFATQLAEEVYRVCPWASPPSN